MICRKQFYVSSLCLHVHRWDYKASHIFVQRNRKWKSFIKDAYVDTSQERKKKCKIKAERLIPQIGSEIIILYFLHVFTSYNGTQWLNATFVHVLYVISC